MPINEELDPAEVEAERARLLANRQQEELRSVINSQPKKATGARGVLGNILSVAGPILGRGIGDGVDVLGQKLLHPGQEDWQQKLNKAKLLTASSEQEAKRLETDANRRMMDEGRRADRDLRAQQHIRQSETDIRNDGGERLPNPLGGQILEVPTNSDLPQRGSPRVLPSLEPSQMMDHSANTLAQVRDPKTGRVVSQYAVPTQAEKDRRKEESLRKTETIKDEVAQRNWPTVTEQMATAVKGLRVGEKVDPATAREAINIMNREEKGWQVQKEIDDNGNIQQWFVNPEKQLSTKPVKLDAKGKTKSEEGSYLPEYNPANELLGYKNPKTGNTAAPGFAGATRSVPPLSQGDKEKLAGIDSFVGDLNQVKSKIVDGKTKTSGPVWGRVLKAKIDELGGWGTSEEERQLASWLHIMFQSKAFSEGGKTLSPTEVGQFKYSLPSVTDTVEQALTKIETNLKAAANHKADRIRYLSPQQQKLYGESGVINTPESAKQDDIELVRGPDGKLMRKPKVN